MTEWQCDSVTDIAGSWDAHASKNHRENIFGGSWQKWKKNSGEGCETIWNETNVKWN